MSARFFRLCLKLLRGGRAASFIFSLALVSAAEAEVCFLPTVGANGSCSGSNIGPDPDQDKCPTGYTAYASKPDCGIGKKAEQNGTVNGKGCYKCVDEKSSDCSQGRLEKDLGTCVDGKTKKEVGKTNSGLKCYECVDDVCPEGYTSDSESCKNSQNTGYAVRQEGVETPSGGLCYTCGSCKTGYQYQNSTPNDTECTHWTQEADTPCYKSSDTANVDACPNGGTQTPCDAGQTETERYENVCHKICYKCEAGDNNQICLKFDLYCNGQKCSSEQINELNAKNEFNQKAFQITVNSEDLPITEDTKICDEPEKMLKEYEISSSVTKDSSLGSWKFENSLDKYVYQPTELEGEEYLTFKKINDKYHAVSWWQAYTECESIENDNDYNECMRQRYYNGTGEPLVGNTYTYRIDLHKAGADERCIYYKVKCYHLPTVEKPSFWNYNDSTSAIRKAVWDGQYEGWSYNDYGNTWAKDCVKIYGKISSSGDESRINQSFGFKQMTKSEIRQAAYGEKYALNEEGEAVDIETGDVVNIQWTDQQKFFQNLAGDEVVLKSCDFQEWDTVDLTVFPMLGGESNVTDDDGKKFFWGGYIFDNNSCKKLVKNENERDEVCQEETKVSSLFSNSYKTTTLYPYVYLMAPVSVGFDEKKPCYDSEFVSSWKLLSTVRPLPVDLRLGPTLLGLHTSNSTSSATSIFSIYGAFGNDGLVSKGAWEADYGSGGQTEFRHKRSQLDGKVCYTIIDPEKTNMYNSVHVAVVVYDNFGNEHIINITEGEPFKANMSNLSEDYEGDNYIYLFGKGIQTN